MIKTTGDAVRRRFDRDLISSYIGDKGESVSQGTCGYEFER
jgi:hypothetical protein